MKPIHYILIGLFSVLTIWIYYTFNTNRAKTARGKYKLIKIKKSKEMFFSLLQSILIVLAPGIILYFISGDIYVFMISVIYVAISLLPGFFHPYCILFSPEGIKPRYISPVEKWEIIEEIIPDSSKPLRYVIKYESWKQSVTFTDEAGREEFLQGIVQFKGDLNNENLNPSIV